ncbi:hypothetical protein [Spirillospora sp. CA-294931]|uniref:hypothetical protein n=1 Tax=Spirillospora sp. CA-294931 TaxID=3240042 RepID=UPI003D8AE161
MTSENEKTLVLFTDERTEKGARKMLPKLPETCFAEADGVSLRHAAERGVRQIVFVGTMDALTSLATGARPPGELLSEITADMGGTPELAAEVASTGNPGELWESAGVLGPCGRELCRRAAGVLEEEAGGALAAQVVLVDSTGERMIGMFGRMAR